MSDLILNIRIGLYHLQVTQQWRFRIRRNNSHRGYPDGFFAVYQIPFIRP